jgi:hypothetical protein
VPVLPQPPTNAGSFVASRVEFARSRSAWEAKGEEMAYLLDPHIAAPIQVISPC